MDPTFYGAKHAGVDYLVPMATPIYACHDGTVTKAYISVTLGRAIWLSDGHTETRYGHNVKLLVSAGQKVKEGQMIALAGSTGLSTAPHCHLEMRIDGKLVDPLSIINQSGGTVTQKEKDFEKFYALWQAGAGKYPHEIVGLDINKELAHIKGIFDANIAAGKSFAEADSAQWRQYEMERINDGSFKF